MHPRLCIHEHFDLITNPFKYNVRLPKLLNIDFKNSGECKIQLMSSQFNNIQSE